MWLPGSDLLYNPLMSNADVAGMARRTAQQQLLDAARRIGLPEQYAGDIESIQKTYRPKVVVTEAQRSPIENYSGGIIQFEDVTRS